jgi:hypothetical protein
VKVKHPLLSKAVVAEVVTERYGEETATTFQRDVETKKRRCGRVTDCLHTLLSRAFLLAVGLANQQKSPAPTTC